MSLTINTYSNFCFCKRNELADNQPAFISKSERLMKDSIIHQIETFAQEIVNHGFQANRAHVKTHIRGELYDRIRNLIVRYLAKHPHQSVYTAVVANSGTVRNLIGRNLPQYRPYLNASAAVAPQIPAAAFPVPSFRDAGRVESATSERALVEDEDSACNRTMLEEQLDALIEERTALRAQLNSLKFEEDKLAHIISNLLDQPREVAEQNHKKRKAPLGQNEHKPAKSKLLSHEDRIKHLEQAIARTQKLIGKLQQEITKKKQANQLEHRKVAIIVERRDRVEQVREAIPVQEEEMSVPVVQDAQNSESTREKVPQEVKGSPVSQEVLKLVPRSVLIARKKSRC